MSNTPDLPPSLSTQWEIADMVLRERRMGRGLFGEPSARPRDQHLAQRAVRLAKARAVKARAAMLEA